ncbi:ABC transporter permease [Bradyrhizobium cosmicum]|uniref:ABC transporter permease n=1 Tax=Bradyrhizobium cosmicum TaxID=1404864 RepID=UPI0028ED9968|nr:ABC transporter permease [Bradyrhizobium cosmicum]
MTVLAESPPAKRQKRGEFRVFARRNPTIVLGTTLLIVIALIAILAPAIAGDPMAMSPSQRLRGPSAEHWFGTDDLGRDVFARTIFGARVSLVVGFSVAILAIAFGLLFGLVAGYFRRLDAVVMRIMDGAMAIPSFLLAIALVALSRGSLGIVVIAIAVPQVPTVVRLVRSIVLSTRSQDFVDAAVVSGSRDLKIICRHILPSTVAPLIVLGTSVIASAILTEAALSFLGAGVPPEIPTWGNMVAASRLFLARAPWTIFFPGAFLTVVILAVNLLGDGLRDRLDPRLSRRM